MKSKTLSAPLRVYWDLSPEDAGGLAPAGAQRVAGELSFLKVFFVTLRLLEGPRPDTGGLVRILKAGGVKVTVSVDSPDLLTGLDAPGSADMLDLRPAGPEPLDALLGKAMPGGLGGIPLSVSAVPKKDGAGMVLDIVSAGLKAGVRSFNLTNPDIVNNPGREAEFVLGEKDREELKRGLEALLKPLGNGVRLLVHDLFLHKALSLPGLGSRIEYAGCQAGDSIAYIDKAGLAYPCMSWPVRLGDLRSETLKEIWSGEARRRLRERAAALPGKCGDCPEGAGCKGGCRGLAWQLGGYDSRDPNCGRQ